MTLFILQFTIFSGLLYLAYRLLFSRMSFFKLNRAILLTIPAISILIPLIAPQFEAPKITQPAITAVLQEVNINGDFATAKNGGEQGFNWWQLAYGIGVAVVFLYITIGLVKGWKILRNSTHAFENIHFSDLANGPFAFFKRIVIPSQLLHSEKLETIVSHEKAHVEQHHGFDNLYYNLLSAIFWFNPFIHLLNRELRQTHECLADEAALQKTPRENYAQLLLSSAFGSELSFDSANRFFNSSLIKTRITMMYKAKTKQKMKVLYLVLLPLLVVMTVFSCQKQEEADSSSPEPKEKTEVMGLAEADSPPLFTDCDANASKEEQMKCFQMGIMKHVQENFEYPESANRDQLEGKMYVKFNITEEGEAEDIDVTTKFPEDTDPVTKGDAVVAAIEMIHGLPQLAPALKDGKKVPITFTLPIHMKLN